MQLPLKMISFCHRPEHKQVPTVKIPSFFGSPVNLKCLCMFSTAHLGWSSWIGVFWSKLWIADQFLIKVSDHVPLFFLHSN